MRDRELQARRDLGTTAISRPVAAALALVLGGLCVAPSAIQSARGDALAAWRSKSGPGLGAILHAFELALEDTSPVRSALLPWTQWVETALFATGNRKVLVGRGGWLYFIPDVESLTAPGFLEPRPRPIGGQREEDVARTSGPEALRALSGLADLTRARGIELVVLVVPGKVAIEVRNGAAGTSEAPRNPSFVRFAAELEARGATVLDATPLLARERAALGRPLYLHTDTHWRPEGMAIVARAVSETLRPRLPATPAIDLARRAVGVEHAGDLWRALRLPERPALYLPERATIEQVVTASGDPLRPERHADLLLLGDSFSNIYADATMGWGDGAGLGEQIAFELRRPFDRLAITGGGPAAPLHSLARGEDRLAGKRAVVYQLVAFELLSGDWR